MKSTYQWLCCMRAIIVTILLVFANNIYPQRYIKFHEDIINKEIASPEAWFAHYYGSVEGLSMHKYKTTTNQNSGWNHTTYQLFYESIPLEYGLFTMHEKNGVVVSVNGGRLVTPISMMTSPIISESVAYDLACRYLSVASINYSPGVLIYCPTFWNSEPIFRLSYKFEMNGSDSEPMAIYVDAQNGNIIYARSLVFGYQGTAQTRYSGSVNIETSYDNVRHKYYLHDNIRNISTKVYSMVPDLEEILIEDNDNLWNQSEFMDDLDAALDAHWGAGVAYDYFYNSFGRVGFDDEGSGLSIYANWATLDNAAWNRKEHAIYYGRGSYSLGIDGGKLPFSSLDIIAHEYTHAVFTSCTNASNVGESGAVYEAVSDMFAMCVLNYLCDNERKCKIMWQPGLAIDVNGNASRRMDTPYESENPAYYMDNYWTQNADSFTHHNSTVLSHWFFLVVEGGYGINWANEVYDINPIGFQYAEQILYNAITNYFHGVDFISYSFFAGEVLNSAAELYGVCSQQYNTVYDSFIAVGITPQRYGAYYNNLSVTSVDDVADMRTYFAQLISADCMISGDRHILFHAEEQIHLLPGFSVSSGATFAARIEECYAPAIEMINPSLMPRQQVTKKEEYNDEFYFLYTSSEDLLRIHSDINNDAVYRIYDSVGRLVLMGAVSSNNINVSGIPNGTYLVIIYTNGANFVGKFTK